MKELARIVRPTSGRVVLLTTDRTSYNLVSSLFSFSGFSFAIVILKHLTDNILFLQGLQSTKIYWKQMKQMMVKIGGLKACVYLLNRTSAIFK